MVGDGRLADRLRGPGVHLLGRVDRVEKAALYAGALAVVLPSWCEGYGYTPLEGFAHGTPAVVSDLPALRETAGAGALYVPPGDVEALRAALGGRRARRGAARPPGRRRSGCAGASGRGRPPAGRCASRWRRPAGA